MRTMLICICITSMFFTMNVALAGSPFGGSGAPSPECAAYENDPFGFACQEEQCTQQDIDLQEPECECATAEELEKVIAIHESNIETLAFSISVLRRASAGYTAAMNDISSRVEWFEYEVAGRCALSGLEAYGAGRALTTFKAGCSHGYFAAQCKRAGFTNKEIAKYLIDKISVKEATKDLLITSVALLSRYHLPEEKKPWYYNIPIVGGWCSAYDSSTVVFTAPEVLDELGRNKVRVMREISKLERMLEKEKEAIKALREQIAEACDDPAPIFP